MTEFYKERELRQKRQEQFRNSKVTKYLAELGFRAAVFAIGAVRPDIRNAIKDPERTTGLLQDSILAPNLCYNSRRVGSLVLKQASAGELLGYDFRRPTEFPIAAKKEGFSQLSKGSILYFDLADTNTKDAEKRTPTTPIIATSLDHLLSFSKPSLEVCVHEGLLVRRTHEEAYEVAGATEFIDELRVRRMADQSVFQVTPRGNSLIHLVPVGGEAQPRRSAQPEFDFGLLPGVKIA